MLPFKLVYHPGYDLNLGEHVFPSRKYRLIHDHLLDEDFAEPEDFIEPQPASDEDILRVHDPGWVHRLKTGTLSVKELVKLEIPYSPEMVAGILAGHRRHDSSGAQRPRAIASASTSAADFIMRFPAMAKDSARFTTWPWPFGRCNTRD